MKLLSVDLARSVWLGPLSDLNPRGISLYPLLFSLLIKKYKFKKFPPPPLPGTGIPDLVKGVKFENGDFNIGSDHPIWITLTLYGNGVVADTGSSTDHSDLFLEEILNQFSEIFKLPIYQSIIRKKTYLSHIHVSMDKSIEILNPKLKKISQYLSNNVEQGDKSFQCGGIHFWPDQTDKINPPAFKLERAIGVPFSENRYFSLAPLPTEKHLELLNKFEAILS